MAKINDQYDVGAAFEAIENELIASMIRNMKRHKQEEIDEDKQWSMWQAEQLKALEKYKKENHKRYGKQFKDINDKIEALIRIARDEGEMQQEIQILNAIKKGFSAKKAAAGATAEFFKLNDRKLEALIKATTDDMQKAENAVLRMANDQYRKVIYNAQVYANTGAGTYEKAVDMATKDFLYAGLTCIEYANGARHTLADYADMAIRTACKRAYLQGEGQKRQEWGISTVIVNKRGNPCPLCLPFVGKVLIDDVWSNGPKDGKSPETGIKYPLMSSAVKAGLYHPRCRDSHTTYFEGISAPPEDKYTKEELDDLVEKNRQEARQQYAERQEKKFERIADFSLDPDNRKKYRKNEQGWRRKLIEEKSKRDNELGYNADTFTSKHRERYNTLKAEEDDIYQKIEIIEQKQKEYEKQFLDTFDEEYWNKAAEYESLSNRIREELKPILGEKKELQKIRVKDAERTFVDRGYVKRIKLSEDMSVESVDILESTMEELVSKKGLPGLEEIEYNPDFFKRLGNDRDGIALYGWDEQKIYLNKHTCDDKQFAERRKLTEKKYAERKQKYQEIWEKHVERIKEELKDADTKEERYLRQKDLNEALSRVVTMRSAVPENVKEVIIHEYGHYLHDLASIKTSEPGKKKIYGLKEIGGRNLRNRILWKDDMSGKLKSAYISEYAKENPLEAFAESFVAYLKGEKIPENLETIVKSVIEKTKKTKV